MIASFGRGWWLIGLLIVSAAVLAQPTPTAEPKDGKDAKDAREAAEAMERARRLAANPLRLIQEASRVRRRGDTEVAVVPVAATAEAAGLPGAPAPREAGALPEPAARVVRSGLSLAPVGFNAAPSLELPARPLQPDTAWPTLQPLSEGIVRLVIVSRVDPEVPARVLAELLPNTVVTSELTVRADGSVREVAIVSPNGRSLMRYIVPALMRWRFEPLPSERKWRVALVFQPE